MVAVSFLRKAVAPASTVAATAVGMAMGVSPELVAATATGLGVFVSGLVATDRSPDDVTADEVNRPNRAHAYEAFGESIAQSWLAGTYVLMTKPGFVGYIPQLAALARAQKRFEEQTSLSMANLSTVMLYASTEMQKASEALARALGNGIAEMSRFKPGSAEVVEAEADGCAVRRGVQGVAGGSPGRPWRPSEEVNFPLHDGLRRGLVGRARPLPPVRLHGRRWSPCNLPRAPCWERVAARRPGPLVRGGRLRSARGPASTTSPSSCPLTSGDPQGLAYWPLAGGRATMAPVPEANGLCSPMIGRGQVIVNGAPIGRTGSTEPVKVSSFTVASAGDPPLASARPTGPCLPSACHGLLRGCDRGEGRTWRSLAEVIFDPGAPRLNHRIRRHGRRGSPQLHRPL